MSKIALPVDDVLPQILNCLISSGALVIKAEPGAGKTTRVPPAILDAGLAQLDKNKNGEIIVLQPRRVAARAAAARISEERGTELGQETGYQVRFEKKVSSNTRILICTEGVFLRRLQLDPFLENVAAVVLDEFHERSIDSDLALSMVRQVRAEVRDDLKIVVMSATLDCEPISQYLGGCPIVECPGRVFPVEIEFSRFAQATNEVEKNCADGVLQMMARRSGDVLVFLPGVGEIRKTQDQLESVVEQQDYALMPLYGDMPLEEQRRVLLPSTQRKIVLATNVAETSITIDGVTIVIDSGLARTNRLDAQLGLNRLQLGRISRASAEQRAGRAGRTSPGVCLRLWTEREHLSLRDFEEPEISRVELSQCLLQLLLWGESDLRNYSWFESPPPQSVEQSMQLLERLDALEGNGLSALGKRMVALSLQPRLARLLVEGERLGETRRAALCAALLSERDPFRRKSARGQAVHQTDSDVIDRLCAIEEFAARGIRDSYVGELLSGAAKQILRASDQLFQNASESAVQPTSNPATRSDPASKQTGNFSQQTSNSTKQTSKVDTRTSDAANQTSKAAHQTSKPDPTTRASQTSNAIANAKSDEAIMRALMTAFPDRICKRREPNGRRAVMVGGRGVRLAEESAVASAELFLAVELVDTGQSESMVRQASAVERSWLSQSQLSTTIDVAFDPVKERVTATKRSKFCEMVLSETIVAVPPEADTGTVLAAAILANKDLSSLIDEFAAQYLQRLRCLREWMPELNLPELNEELWKELLPEWCMGSMSIDDLRSKPLTPYIQMRLTAKQIADIENETPDHITLPSGRRVKLTYEADKPPILAARIQELFGLSSTPRIAGSRISVLLHLLAPNYRVQQITPDLASFWKNTYEDVRKELKGRYPKHPWPQDPLIPLPERINKKDR